VLSLVGVLLFLGVVGKSAQLGLHAWLPDAMEGPTPVSALIHAATMVTAGIFLIIKMSFFFEFIPLALMLMLFVGSMTAFTAALIAFMQDDLKKIIAFSTCSQLGYMVFMCGLSQYDFAFYHLINHAFFKALLFLSSGVIIHLYNNSQDIRKINGVREVS
jgi:NADH:ubiquinone oxidoreductase subunit 5 (subunit L)/multisubunit Na+/H+ antiporter MnhA subunit